MGWEDNDYDYMSPEDSGYDWNDTGSEVGWDWGEDPNASYAPSTDTSWDNIGQDGGNYSDMGWDSNQSQPSYDWDAAVNEWANQQPMYGYQQEQYPGMGGSQDFNANINNGPGAGGGVDWSKILSGAGGALKDVFAPRSATSANPEWGSLINALRGVAGMGKAGLGFMSAADEKQKQQKYLDYINDLRMQTQQSGALDPSAKYRQEAAGYWQQNNPTLQTLLSGGTTANMQQELNAARMAAQRQGGKSGNRFSAFAARQEPYMMAQARKNDFQMQQDAQKQRWAELATRGDTGSMMDLIKLNAGAYRDSLTNPMYAAGGKALQDFLGQGSSVDGNQLMDILSKIQRNTGQQ